MFQTQMFSNKKLKGTKHHHNLKTFLKHNDWEHQNKKYY
jgi:hypothetical protein